MELVKGQRTRVDALTASTALGIDVALDGRVTHDDLGKITLDKGTVSLAKDQTVSLEKGGAPVLTKVAMGLGWEMTAIGAFRDGKTVRNLVRPAAEVLARMGGA